MHKNIIIGFLIFIIIVISIWFGISYSSVSGDLATCTTNLDTCNTNLSTSNTNLSTSNTKLATSNSIIKNNEDYFNELIKNNLELTAKVKNDPNYKNYAGCIRNVMNLPFYRAFQGDDGGSNATRIYYCSPYYTNGSAGDFSQDYRKPVFK